MDAWKKKKARAAKKKADKAKKEAEEKAAAEYVPPELSSDDEEPPPPLSFDGKLLTVTPGVTITLLPSNDAPRPAGRGSIEDRFVAMHGGLLKFDWDSLPPGRRPDTLVIQGLPFEFFQLTPSTLQRHRVASGSSWLRRVMSSFGAVWDIDVRPETPAEVLDAQESMFDLSAKMAALRGDLEAEDEGGGESSCGDKTTGEASDSGEASKAIGGKPAPAPATAGGGGGSAELSGESSSALQRPHTPSALVGAASERSALFLLEADGDDSRKIPTPAEGAHRGGRVGGDGERGGGRGGPAAKRRPQEPIPPRRLRAKPQSVTLAATTAIDGDLAVTVTVPSAGRRSRPGSPQQQPPQQSGRRSPGSSRGASAGAQSRGGSRGGGRERGSGSRGASGRTSRGASRGASRGGGGGGGGGGDDDDFSVHADPEAETFEALVCFRTYGGFLASLEGFGGRKVWRRDGAGAERESALTVRPDYSGYFSAEGLARRAAKERAAIKAAHRAEIQREHALLRLVDGARDAAQAARVAACAHELTATDFEVMLLSTTKSLLTLTSRDTFIALLTLNALCN